MPAMDRDINPYPDTAVDFAKIVRAAGLEVEYEDADRSSRTYLAHNAADLWIPVIQVGVDLLVGMSAGLITNMIQRYLDRRKIDQTILHVEYRIVDSDGQVQAIKIDGRGPDVIGALSEFEGKQIERTRSRAVEARSEDEKSDPDHPLN
ncbi:hypothetical protein GCM10023175_70610 [Pseudonocardia xishanensis]|uniref:Uncharacterized protein n=2 Tax=Pseudonocardia xishanensis TaxID=630995 RepID=A0ABP8S3E3_9PSEU